MRVQVWRADFSEWEAALRSWAEELIAAHPEVLIAVLFGSLARGEATAWSDADVLLLLRDSSEPFKDRVIRYAPVRMAFPVEVFAYTIGEAEVFLKQRWGFFPSVLVEGKVLATSPEGELWWKEKQVLMGVQEG
ncbi:MAG: nucleotidyltransferase domain-containing protein [Bacteroidia bacterium]|nr:nucleotidyltransferase domain-containing protein [Bacteroidia bacterium]